MSTAAPHPTPLDRTCVESLLREAPVAYVAMVDSVGPYVVPMNFVYEPAETPAAMGRLLLHTGEGRKTEVLSRDPRVCVAIAADESFDQGATPCQDGFAFRTVLIEGSALLLEDETRREAALRAIVAKYDPTAAALPLSPDALAKTLVYAVTIETLSYRERPRRGPR